MSDISITAANVKKGSNAVTEEGTAGETITAGQVVTKDPTTGKYVKTDTDHATAALRVPRGIALHAASADQPITVQRSGDITIGATITAGTDYWASNTAGGICPRADVASERAVLLGVAKSTTVLALDIQDSGVTL